MTKRMLSLMLSFFMVFSLLPGHAHAGGTEEEQNTVYVGTWEELADAMADGKHPNAADPEGTLDIIYVNASGFVWPEDDRTLVIDVYGDKTYNNDVKIVLALDWEDSTWSIPSNITVECYEPIYFNYMDGDQTIEISGTWTCMNTAAYFSDDTYIASMSTSKLVVNGTLYTAASGYMSQMYEHGSTVINGKLVVQKGVYLGNVVLNGEIEHSLGSQFNIKNLTMGAGARVYHTGTSATMNIFNSLTGPSEGRASLEINVCIQPTDVVTMGGSLDMEYFYIQNGRTITIAEGAAIRAARVRLYEGAPTLNVNGSLTISETSSLGFDDAAAINIGESGVIKLEPAARLGEDGDTATVSGTGRIELYADYDHEGGSYYNKAEVFGLSDEHPAQVADTVTVWRLWENACESHDWDEDTKVTTPPTCNEGGYDTLTCKTCGTKAKLNYTDATGLHKITVTRWQSSPNKADLECTVCGSIGRATITANNVVWTGEAVGDASLAFTGYLAEFMTGTYEIVYSNNIDACEEAAIATVTIDGTEIYDTFSIVLCQHEGGEATCESLAVCTKCGLPYGELMPHTEGTAPTCESLAVCSVCGKEYGELKAHSLVIKHDESTHWVQCASCDYTGLEDVPEEDRDEYSREYLFMVIMEQQGGISDELDKWLETHEDITVHAFSTDNCEQAASCMICGFGKEAGSHTGGEATCTSLAVCTVCGSEYGEYAQHDWSSDISSDAQHHWFECLNPMCSETTEKQPHTSGGITDCTKADSCTLCAYELRAAGRHTPSSDLEHDEEGHWHVCTVCSLMTDEAKIPHSSDNTDCTAASICECGFTIKEAGSHSFGEWTHDAEKHEKTCTVCGAAESAPHTAVTDPFTPPTESSEGRTEGSHCEVCGYVIKAQETIPALRKQHLSFAASSVTRTYGDEPSINTAYNDSEGGSAIIYSSSNENVATVDQSGKVTIVGAGEATITAYAAAVEHRYLETSLSYTFTVNKAPLTLTAGSCEITYGSAFEGGSFKAEGFVYGEDSGVLSGNAVYTTEYKAGSGVGTYAIALSGLSSDNYDISFTDGVLTVVKNDSYTITLSNLSQTAGRTSPVEATLSPSDASAVVKVEYQLVDGTWTAEVPTEKGEYPVRAFLTASDNLILNESIVAEGTLTVKARASIGADIEDVPADDTLDVDSGNENVSVDVTVENGTVEVIVTDNELSEIVEKVPATGEVVVDLTSIEDAQQLVLPSELITALSGSDKAESIVVRTEAAELTIDSSVMDTLSDKITSANDKVVIDVKSVSADELNTLQQKALDSITNDAVIVELELKVVHYNDKGEAMGEEKLHELGGEAEVTVMYELPEDMEGKHVVVAYISDDGSVTYIRAQYADGYVTFTTDHFSVFAIMTSYAAAFDDVDLNSWYAQGVEYAAAKGITNGVSQNLFAPDMSCTRAQAVTFLWRAAGSPMPENSDMPFTDVSEDAYCYNAVLWAVGNGITNGVSETEFAPAQACTRAQIVTFLWRAEGAPKAESADLFSDTPSGAYYCDAVLWAVENSITNGVSDTEFAPDQTCTRAHIVTFIERALS